MGRPRQYATAAERQRAYRERLESEAPRISRRAWDGLQLRLEHLKTAREAAAQAGDPVAKACPANTAETLLEQLIRYFQAAALSPSAPAEATTTVHRPSDTKRSL